jgi:hypothetical protein
MLAVTCLCLGCAFPSAPAQASIGNNSSANAALEIDQNRTVLTDNTAAGPDFVAQNIATGEVSGIDPLSVDPMTRGLLLAGSAPVPGNWTPTDSGSVNNAAPKSTDGAPLLIPLPTAASAGACGLLAVACLLGARRTLRRRLFA